MQTERKRRMWLVIIPAVAIAGALGIYQHPRFVHQNATIDAYSTQEVWEAASCRASLYLQKVRGELPELSWADLWAMTRLSHGFHCTEGSSLAANLQYSASANEDDRQAGAHLFHARCTGCHGRDGAGGALAPSLTRPQFSAGDSDLAIFQVLRNGRPGTAMRPIDLPARELLQITAYLATLKSRQADSGNTVTQGPGIEVSSERLRAAGSRTDEWLTYSGSYNGQRHTVLDEITPANVAGLRIRWVKQFDIDNANIEAAPLVADGVMFMVPAAGRLLALDAKTGNTIWEYKKSLPRDLPQVYGSVNRGLALHGHTLYFGSLDGQLIAINAQNGTVLWQTAVVDPSDGYVLTGAPLVVGHSVIIGVSGGEYRIRGFLSAYDVDTGKQQWRFDTVPGPDEVGHETWKNDAWRTGGGATWVTGSYDPATDLLYWGVGNPSPAFNGDVRPGDNLFTDSVIALQASTGKLAWYFQFTPHDEHDRDAAQTPVLADLMVRGVIRKVILWPNRNGFYYVLDRTTGEYLVGVPFVETDWATTLTPAGRPVLTDYATVTAAGRRTKPGINGGVNWQNSAFDPRRETIFVPAAESSSVFTKAAADEVPGKRTVMHIGSGWSETDPATNEVVALDAATGQRKWQHFSPSASSIDGSHGNASYSGLLSTGSGLVFGASAGVVFALDADSGREIWHLPLGGTTKSAPISFTIDGHQVIAVSAGRALFVLGL